MKTLRLKSLIGVAESTTVGDVTDLEIRKSSQKRRTCLLIVLIFTHTFCFVSFRHIQQKSPPTKMKQTLVSMKSPVLQSVGSDYR